MTFSSIREYYFRMSFKMATIDTMKEHAAFCRRLDCLIFPTIQCMYIIKYNTNTISS